MDKRLFAILALLFLTLSFSVSATAAMLATIAQYFNRDPLLVGKLVWAYMLPYGLGALLWGPLTRKFSTKRILLAALFLFSLSSFTVSNAPTLAAAFGGI